MHTYPILRLATCSRRCFLMGKPR